MRNVVLVLVLSLVACKEKEAAKPAPATGSAPAPVAAPQGSAATEPAKPVVEKPAIKPAGGINTAAEYEAKAFDLMDKLTAVFASSGTNCDKLADNLEVFLDVNKDAIMGTEQFQKVNPSAEDDLEPKLQSRIKGFMDKATLSLKACEKHAGVSAALAKLPD